MLSMQLKRNFRHFKRFIWLRIACDTVRIEKWIHIPSYVSFWSFFELLLCSVCFDRFNYFFFSRSLFISVRCVFMCARPSCACKRQLYIQKMDTTCSVWLRCEQRKNITRKKKQPQHEDDTILRCQLLCKCVLSTSMFSIYARWVLSSTMSHHEKCFVFSMFGEFGVCASWLVLCLALLPRARTPKTSCSQKEKHHWKSTTETLK